MTHHLAFSGAQALVGGAVASGAASYARVRPAPAGAHAISVEVAHGAQLSTLHSEWQNLSSRADAANVFMHPIVVKRAADCYPARRCFALLAWQEVGTTRRLAGIWAFAIGHAMHVLLPVPTLVAPAMPHGYLATPVIDRECLEAVLDAMVSHIASDDSLPKIVTLDAMGADTATMQALTRVLAARQCPSAVLSRAQRPTLASTLDASDYLSKAFSKGSRKKLRQHRRRLAEKGALQFDTVTEAAAVSGAFEDFLTLEAAGWKGRRGTALLSRADDAAFARAMIVDLAERGEAAIYRLTLDAQPISVQVVLRAGRAAFTWKTAYDETMHDTSPGMLLFEDYTAALLADRSIASVDSCAFDDSGYMSAWMERATVAQLWFDVRPGRSIIFFALGRLQSGYLALRAWAKALHRKYKSPKRIQASA